MINPEAINNAIKQLSEALEEEAATSYEPIDASENPIWNDDKVITLADDDEWNGFDRHGVEIDTNSFISPGAGDVSFVLYVRPKHLPETPEYPPVMDDRWSVGVIRVPFDMIIALADSDEIIIAIENRNRKKES